MLYVFSSNEVLQAILAQDGGTCPYWDAVHTEELNIQSSFEFSCPANHKDAAYCVEGALVAFKDLDNNFQLFEIKRVEETHASELVKKCFCENAALELLDEHIEDVRPTNKTAFEALTSALSGTRWQAGTVEPASLVSTNFYRTNPIDAIQNILSVWGGEIAYRVEISNNQIVGRYIDILNRRGSVTGKRFEYGKDLIQVDASVDTTNLKTALYGYGKGVESGGGYSRRLTFSDVVWTTPTNPANKPVGQDWVGDEDALATWGRAGGTRHRFGSYELPDVEDPAVLLQKTWDQLQKQKDPLVNYKMSVVSLEELTGYAHEAVRLGDSVAVIDKSFEPRLRLNARVIKIKRHLPDYEKTEITLGNFLPYFTKTKEEVADLANRAQGFMGSWGADVTQPAISTSVLDGIIDVLKNEVQSTNGYVRITDADGIIIYDTPDPLTATKALRLKAGIFAIANSKTAGNWDWSTFGTGDGFTADHITAGTMLADRIFGGMLTLGGLNDANGILRILDAAGNAKVTGNNEGLEVYNANFLVKDDYSSTPTQLTPAKNLLGDPSFELLEPGNPDTNIIYTNEVLTNAYLGSISMFWKASQPVNARILTMEGADGSGLTIGPYDGAQCAVLGHSSWNYYSQQITLAATNYYNISAYFSAFQATVQDTNAVIEVYAYNSTTGIYTYLASSSLTINHMQVNVWKRSSVTVQSSSFPAGTDYLEIRLYSSVNSANYILCDAVSIAPTNYPVFFNDPLAGHFFGTPGTPYSIVACDGAGDIYVGNKPAIGVIPGSSLFGGAPPTTSGHFYMQGGTSVVVYATGGSFINFPSAFTGVLTVVANIGGGYLNYFASIVEAENMPGGFKFVAFSGGTEYPNGAAIRIDWIAIGWV